jgi:polysaccharide biosynthesis/export protein
MTRVKAMLVFCCACVCAAPATARAQGEGDAAAVAAEYVIGAGDVLGIKFWQQDGMSGDVVVRPDGMISVPLLKDVQASGMTPQQLSDSLAKTATRWVQDPNVTVIVRQINSRAVYITGRVMRAGRYPLNGATSVLQLIAMAGGLDEWANAQNVIVMRSAPTGLVTHHFNYKAVLEHKDLAQNIELEPNDTVIVP